MVETETTKSSTAGPSVLITGGSGLIGRYLTATLLSEGYSVAHLLRNTGTSGKVRVFRWDPEKKIIDPGLFEGVDYLIHLAGANIGDKLWTKGRKDEIVTSRVETARFLHKIISENRITLKGFITASAIGYYGSLTSDRILNEEDPPAEDFLGVTCRLWEEAAGLFADMGIRTVRIRTAVVLGKSDSTLNRLMLPAKFGLVVRVGNGKQYFPWIHIRDLCNIYLMALKNRNMRGAYNAVAPEHINHNDFVRTMAAVMNKPVFLPPVPAGLIRMIMGEMSDIVLKGSRISGEKITRAGYSFRFEKLDAALNDIIRG